jgi:nitrogen fixation protein
MQVIIYQNGAGVSVVCPTADYADQIEAVAAKDVPGGATWRVIDAASLPDRESRDRWVWTAAGPIEVAD